MVAGMFGMFFLGVLYLQRVLGYDAVEIGFAFLPVSLGIGALSLGPLAAARACGSGRATVLLAGLTSLAAGLALFSQRPGRRQLRHRRPARDGAARRRRRPLVPRR